MQHQQCSICTDPLSDETSSHRLPCGHTFHTECIVQWFRYEHTTCPLCRSEENDRRWTRHTPGQRVAILKRRKRSLPTVVQQKLARLDACKRHWETAKHEHKTLRKEYETIFRSERHLGRRIDLLREEHNRIFRELSVQASEHVPLLQPYDGSDDDASDDD